MSIFTVFFCGTSSTKFERLSTIKASYDNYTVMRNIAYTLSSDIKDEREIYNFTAAHSPSYTPVKGLSTRHILSSDYYNDTG